MTPRTDERPKTIFLKPRYQQHEEGKAKDNEDIYPGMLIDIDASSVDTPRTPEVVKKHAVAGAAAVLRICKEDFLQGKGIGDVIVDGDIVPYLVAVPGEVFLARVAPTFVAAAGIQLQSNGDGTFVAQTGGGIPLVQLEGAYDLTAWDITDLEATDARAQPLVRVKAL